MHCIKKRDSSNQKKCCNKQIPMAWNFVEFGALVLWWQKNDTVNGISKFTGVQSMKCAFQ
jgi:hypothetical protein